MSTGSDTPDPFELQTMFYYQYGVAVYSNLFTGIVYGERHKRLAVTRPTQFLNQCALNMITGAYIVVYVISTYVIL